jgi:hypothetical protein
MSKYCNPKTVIQTLMEADRYKQAVRTSNPPAWHDGYDSMVDYFSHCLAVGKWSDRQIQFCRDIAQDSYCRAMAASATNEVSFFSGKANAAEMIANALEGYGFCR